MRWEVQSRPLLETSKKTVPELVGCSGAMHKTAKGVMYNDCTTSLPNLHAKEVELTNPNPVMNTGVLPPVMPDLGVTAETRRLAWNESMALEPNRPPPGV